MMVCCGFSLQTIKWKAAYLMRKLLMILALGLVISFGSPDVGQAQSLRDTLVAQLSDLGFDEIKVGRTLLGRVRITAENEDFYREIVINPRTNVILRDYLRRKVRDGKTVSFRDPYEDEEDEEEGEDHSSSGGDDDDDGQGDDESDDEEDEDEEDEEEEDEDDSDDDDSDDDPEDDE